jgi:transcriptional regulator of NAD metabolism
VNGTKRREQIFELLKERNDAIKGSELAEILGVSRQVIVQDIALLRAEGHSIVATPQGYMIMTLKRPSFMKSVMCAHTGIEEMRDELYIMVDNGATVVDVTVEHPVYGEIAGNLMLKNRIDVQNFISKVIHTKAEPLSILTGGVHFHTLEVSDEDSFQRIIASLKGKGYLMD